MLGDKEVYWRESKREGVFGMVSGWKEWMMISVEA